MNQVLDVSKLSGDLRLLSLPKEFYDGIWCDRVLSAFNIEDCQRILVSFFQALKPQTGVLFVSFQFPETAFLSLLRQSGFTVTSRASADDATGSWIGVVAGRP